MRKLCASVLALSLMASSSIAGESGALPPGQPAGVAGAQSKGISTFYVITAGLVLLVGAAFLISTDHSKTSVINLSANGETLLQGINSPPTTTTTTTTQ